MAKTTTTEEAAPDPRASAPGRLHHLALGAQDVAGLARFYAEALGLAELQRHYHADGRLRSVWLDLGTGGAVLMIEEAAESPRVVSGIGAGLFLLAVQASPGERPAVEQRLEAAGGRIEHRTEHSTYARDPEGHRVAVSSYPLPVRA